MQQSIAMVGGAGEALVEAPLSVAPEADDTIGRAYRAVLEMEASVKASGLDWLILRGGFFYGPGTGTEDGWFAQAAAGKLRLPGQGAEYLSLIHIADMAAATVAAVARWPSRQVLSVTDDGPARWRDVLGHVAVLAGVPAPEAGGSLRFPSFRVSNRAARDVLGWAPFYPDYRAGLAR
jgi:nucleoside-diphosphate-sugar epimerase